MPWEVEKNAVEVVKKVFTLFSRAMTFSIDNGIQIDDTERTANREKMQLILANRLPITFFWCCRRCYWIFTPYVYVYSRFSKTL